MSDGKVQNLPLVIDLDGTLCLTDTLWELWLKALSSRPLLALYALFLLLLRGRLCFKLYLADKVLLEVCTLPYNRQIIDLIKSYKDEGGAVWLVTAQAESLARSIASHLGLFDRVKGSSSGINLKGKNKLAWLKEALPEGFDYAGDSKADLPLFAAAHKSYVVAKSPGAPLVREARKLTGTLQVLLLDRSPTFKLYLKALRLYQCPKNLLVFLPLLLSHSFTFGAAVAGCCAFLLFTLAASGGYLLNDLLDLASDRLHPQKCHRPFACGSLPLASGFLTGVLLQLVPPLLALCCLNPGTAVILSVYILLNLSYSLRLKEVLFLDVLVLTSLYLLRIMAGAYAIGAPLSVWIVLASSFAFLTLALTKRITELKVPERNGAPSDRAVDSLLVQPNHRRAYQYVDKSMLGALGAASVCCLVFTFIFYSSDVAAFEHYRHPEYVALCAAPLFYLLGRMLLLAYRGSMQHDPVLFVLTDRQSYLCAALIFSIYLMASL